jgi:hypothetical protein
MAVMQAIIEVENEASAMIDQNEEYHDGIRQQEYDFLS